MGVDVFICEIVFIGVVFYGLLYEVPVVRD